MEVISLKDVVKEPNGSVVSALHNHTTPSEKMHVKYNVVQHSNTTKSYVHYVEHYLDYFTVYTDTVKMGSLFHEQSFNTML